MQDQVVTATKRYILDMLNFMVFGETVTWDGVDQYNALPIFHTIETEAYVEECRGSLLVHKNRPTGFRLLISTHTALNVQKVCYRFVSIKDKIGLDNPVRVILPSASLDFDLSISDLNLGINDSTAKSFYNNKDKTGDISKSVIMSLLRFLLDSEFYAIEDPDVFHDLIEDACSFPPLTFDDHYALIKSNTTS
jgi:hypothetical protein